MKEILSKPQAPDDLIKFIELLLEPRVQLRSTAKEMLEVPFVSKPGASPAVAPPRKDAWGWGWEPDEPADAAPADADAAPAGAEAARIWGSGEAGADAAP